MVINSATRERAKVDKYSKLEDDEDVCVLSAPGAPGYLAEWGAFRGRSIRERQRIPLAFRATKG